MKKIKGAVIAAKREKTVTVEVKTFKTHPLYRKRQRVKKKLSVHDEIGVSQGDQVELVESRPISKTKKWKIVRRIKK